MAGVVVAENFDFDGAVGVGGAAGIGIVGEAVLRAQFAVDAVKDAAQLLCRVGIEHGAAGRVGHGFEGMLTGGVAAAFVFHGADDDSVEERVGARCFPAGRVEVRTAGGFPGVGDQDDDAAAVVAAAFERASAEKNGVVDRGAGAGRYPANRGLQSGDIVGKRSGLSDV